MYLPKIRIGIAHLFPLSQADAFWEWTNFSAAVWNDSTGTERLATKSHEKPKNREGNGYRWAADGEHGSLCQFEHIKEVPFGRDKRRRSSFYSFVLNHVWVSTVFSLRCIEYRYEIFDELFMIFFSSYDDHHVWLTTLEVREFVIKCRRVILGMWPFLVEIDVFPRNLQQDPLNGPLNLSI